MMRSAFAILALSSLSLIAEDNISVTVSQQLQDLHYFVRHTHTGTSSRDAGFLNTTDGRLDLEFANSGEDKDGNPWSSTATAHLTNDYDLETTGDTLSISGSARTDLTFADVNPPIGSQSYNPFWSSFDTWNNPPTIFLRGNLLKFQFTVEKYWVDYDFNFEILENVDASCRAYLLKQIPSSEGPVYSELAGFESIDENLASTGTLTEGNYQLMILIRGNMNCSAEVAFSFELEPDLDDPLITDPPPGGYTHPEIGAVYTDSPKLIVRNPAIASETDLGDGTTKLDVTAELENASARKWSMVNLELAFRKDGVPDLVSATPVTYTELPPHTTEAFPEGESLEVVVANENLDTVKASILDGSRFTTYGRELWSFNHPPVPYDFHSLHEGGDELIYSSSPPVSRGELLVSLPDLYPVPPVEFDNSIPPTLRQGIDQRMPFLVSSITEPSDASLDNSYQINGEKITFLDYMLEGTHVTSLPRIHPATGIDSTGYYGIPGPAYFPHPIHFNRIPISDTIELSGSFAMVPNDFRVEFDMAAGVLKSLYVEGKMTADCNFLLEVGTATDNSASSENARTKTIADFSLFTLVLPAGITFTPQFKFDLSATVEAEAGISIPITTGMEVVFRGGYVDGVAEYDCDVTPIPQRLTQPTLFSAANASLEIEADAQLAFMFRIPETPAIIGPTFGAALIANFQLDALANPAWNIGADLELRAGMEFELAGYFDLVDIEHPLFTTPIFNTDSGAPLGGNPAPLAENDTGDNPGLKPIEGESIRWIRALQPFTNTSETTAMFVVPLQGSDRIIAGGSTTTNGEIACFDQEGGLHWLLNAPFLRPIDAVADPDGSVTVLSTAYKKIQLTRFDIDGTTLWTKAYSLSDSENAYGFENAALAQGLDSQGARQYVVLSRGAQLAPPFYRFPALFKFDAEGQPLWQKAYLPEDNEEGGSTSCELSDVIITQDGNIAYVGITNANVQGSLDTDPQDTSPNLTYNGLAAKVSSETGEAIWGTILASKNIPDYTSIAEDPDGNLYLGGGVQLPVTSTTPSMLLTKLNADGEIVDSVLIGAQAPNLGVPENPFLGQNVPNGGQTLVDTIRDLVWVDDALWFGGKMGFYNSGVGYFTGSCGFTGRATPSLGVSRFAIHAGPAADNIMAVADAGDGLLAFGSSASFLPWPHGGASEADPGPTHRLLMKLPWEGLVRFHSQSAGAHPANNKEIPAQGTYYVYPQVVAASDTTAFSITQDSETPDQDDHPTAASSLAFIVVDLATSEGSPANAPALDTPQAHYALEYAPQDAIKDKSDYLSWSQLDPDADPDKDAWNTASELFFGTDPFVPDAPAIHVSTETDTDGTVQLSLSFPRSHLAADENPIFELSNDLKTWLPQDGNLLNMESLNATQDLLQFKVDLPQTDATFLRLTTP